MSQAFFLKAIGVAVVLLSLVACGSHRDEPVTPSEISDSASRDPYIVTATPNPIYVGYGSQLTPESPATSAFRWSITVVATGEHRGTLESVGVRLLDRQTHQVLGTNFYQGPFTSFSKTVRNPLLELGRQTLDRYDLDLGFVGNAATLEIEANISEADGTKWTATTSAACELFPRPTLRVPVNVMIRQNDPNSGCPFDPVHGYGLLVDIAWDPPKTNLAVEDYTIALADGAGNEIIWPYYAHTKQTSYRLVRCDLHVPPGAEHGARAAVNAVNNTYVQGSGFSVGRFDFQSCLEAGTPACR